MKPATKKMDAQIWNLWRSGTAPKDIVVMLNVPSLGAIYNALHRERRQWGIPVRKGIGRPKKKKKD